MRPIMTKSTLLSGVREVSILGRWILLTLSLLGDGLSSHAQEAENRDSPSRRFEPLGIAERPGPSSRRSGLVISEIHYHPGPADSEEKGEFIEIYNSRSVPRDISGFRIGGDVSFQFGEGTVIPKRSYIVVARTPELLADEIGEGTGRVFGPFEGALPNRNGQVLLENRQGALLLAVHYTDDHPWPVEADGWGPSLCLLRPSYGEGDDRAWGRSMLSGGTPGKASLWLTETVNPSGLILNELVLSDDGRDWTVEIFNANLGEISIEGLGVGFRNGAVVQHPSLSSLAKGEITTIEISNDVSLGLEDGGTLALADTTTGQIVDALRFPSLLPGTSWGRYPQGARYPQRLQSPTAGRPNTPGWIDDIVISEIMYSPISGDDREEYLELWNRGEVLVDVSGWQLSDGIQFEVPEGVVLEAGQGLVIARDAAYLIDKYAHLTEANTKGNYQGRLSNSGERVRLSQRIEKAPGVFVWIAVDEVRYADGGQWDSRADGEGSSLELVDLDSDNRLPSNWRASDEMEKAAWMDVSHTGTLQGGISNADELDMMLLGKGEVLIDKLSVVSDQGRNLITNHDFEDHVQGYVIQGNHVQSTHNREEGFESQGSLHLKASSGGDNGANRIEVQIASPRSGGLSFGSEIDIRAKARWVGGHTNLLFRIQGNYFEGVTALDVPNELGTPGKVNSRALKNVGPAIVEVWHRPIEPLATEPVTVSAQVTDPDGIASVTLHYRLDPSREDIELAMSDDGRGGDEIAGDGIYAAIIPSQSDGSLVAFRIESFDASEGARKTSFPAGGDLECHYRVDEISKAPFFGSYSAIVASADLQVWNRRENLSNELVASTFVLNGERVIYGAGIRFRGSPFIRRGYGNPIASTSAYLVKLPKDRSLFGANELNLDSLEQGSSRDSSLQRERLSFWIGDQLGVPNSHQSYVRMYVNGRRQGLVYADVQQPNGDYFDAWYPNDSDGEIYKIDDWFEFQDGFDFININATLQDFELIDGAKNQARYRWSWERKSNKGLDDDYSSLFSLVDALNAPPSEYESRVRGLIDVDQWLRTFATRHIVGDWDGYGYRRGKNQFAYKPKNGKWQMILWDLDFSLGANSDGPAASLYSTSDPVISRFYNTPGIRRQYLQIILEAVEGPLAPQIMGPVMEANAEALRENRARVANQVSQIGSWVASRRSYLQKEVNRANQPFRILTNGGQGFSADANLLTLSGTAPIEAYEIHVNGVPQKLRWLTESTWEADVLLASGENRLVIEGVDRFGAPLKTSRVVLPVVFNGESVPVEDALVISEIMYSGPESAEFVEIQNRSLSHAFDLSGFRLSGVDHDFQPGDMIAPNQAIVLVADENEFRQRYPEAVNVLGVFQGRLRDDGESLALLGPEKPNGQRTIIDSVDYGSGFPWPTLASEGRASLQLVDRNQSNDRPGNWAATMASDGWRQVVVTGQGTGSELLIYHSPFIEVAPAAGFDGLWSGVIRVPELEGQEGIFPFTVRFERDAKGQIVGFFLFGEGEDEEFQMETSAAGDDISFKFPGDGPDIPRWNGRLSEDGREVSGTFLQESPEIRFEGTFEMARSGTVLNREVLIDRLTLVEGTEAERGENLIKNGDFETPLGRHWQVQATHSLSHASPVFAYSGDQSLRLISRDGGRDAMTAVGQSVRLDPSKTYTLSYWFFPTQTADELYVGMDDGTLTRGPIPVRAMEATTPGRINSVAMSLPAFPELLINELQLENVDSLQDEAGDFDPWLEILNVGDREVRLDNYSLGFEEGDILTEIAGNGLLAASARNLIWLDGELEETSDSEWHSAHRLASGASHVALYMSHDRDNYLVDWIHLGEVSAGESVGRFPDGQAANTIVFRQPTPNAENLFEQSNTDADLVISEWMASNRDTIENPKTASYDDWFELWNRGDTYVDLEGFSVGDELGGAGRYVFPAGVGIPAGGFLLVWASGEPDDLVNDIEQGINVGFRLSRSGERILLFDPEERIVDRVDFGEQTTNVSEGLMGEAIQILQTPSPGSANRLNSALLSIDVETAGFNSQGRFRFKIIYQNAVEGGVSVERAASLLGPWSEVGQASLVDGQWEFTDQSSQSGHGFYRLRGL